MFRKGRSIVGGNNSLYVIVIIGALLLLPNFGINILPTALTVQIVNGEFQAVKMGTEIYSGLNAYQAIQTALNAAGYGETVLIKSGVYPIGSTLIGKSGVNLRGEGLPVFDMSSQPASIIASYQWSKMMVLAGKKGASTGITSDLMKGKNTVTTATSLGASVGSLVFIQSSMIWNGANSNNQYQGEIRKVTAVNGNTLTFEAGVEDHYSASVTRIYLLEPVKDVTIDGIKFLNTQCASYTNGAIRKHFRGLEISYADNIHIVRCEFDGIEAVAIRMDNTINSRIDYCKFSNSTTDGIGYGVQLCYACQNIIIENNHANRCRHWVVAADGGQDYGIARHITVQNNYSQDSIYYTGTTWAISHQYDCHPIGEDINFLYNEATGTGIGLYYQAYSGSIKGNNFHDLSTGGYMGIGLGLSVGEQDLVTIQGNTITNTRTWGIQTGNTNPRYATNIKILDNRITGCPTGIMMTNTKDSTVSGNVITNCGIGINLDSSTSNIQGIGNGCTIINNGAGNNVS